MEHQTVTLKLPPKLLMDVSRVASGQDVTIGHLVRQLLKSEVDRRLGAEPTASEDEGLVMALRVLFNSEIALTQNWPELSLRLADHGYELRPSGTELTIHKRPCGRSLCQTSDIGFPYRRLVRRFRCGMPGHPQGTLGLVFERSNYHRQNPLRQDGDGKFEVIEYDA